MERKAAIPSSRPQRARANPSAQRSRGVAAVLGRVAKKAVSKSAANNAKPAAARNTLRGACDARHAPARARRGASGPRRNTRRGYHPEADPSISRALRNRSTRPHQPASRACSRADRRGRAPAARCRLPGRRCAGHAQPAGHGRRAARRQLAPAHHLGLRQRGQLYLRDPGVRRQAGGRCQAGQSDCHHRARCGAALRCAPSRYAWRVT